MTQVLIRDKPGSSGMPPGYDSRGRNDVRGRGGPSGGRWAGCGSPASPTMQSSMAPSQVVLGGRKVAIRRPRVRRDGAERRIQRGAWRSTTRRSSSMPGSVYGRSCSPAWITRTSLWAVARIHPGSRRSVGATTDAESSAGTPRCTCRCRSTRAGRHGQFLCRGLGRRAARSS